MATSNGQTATIMSSITETVRGWSDAFWTERIWTPPNTTWHEYESNGYRHFNDIYYSLITAVALVIVRLALEKYVYAPVGVSLGIRPGRPRQPRPNAILERAWTEARGKWNAKQVTGLAKQIDMTERQVERWARLRSATYKPTVLTKFTESAWRCTFYFSAFAYGVYVLWDKPWFWDSIYCFSDYPRHYVSAEEWWYYNIASAFYLGLIFSQFFDIQRKVRPIEWDLC